jgi:hypothetical protein
MISRDFTISNKLGLHVEDAQLRAGPLGRAGIDVRGRRGQRGRQRGVGDEQDADHGATHAPCTRRIASHLHSA